MSLILSTVRGVFIATVGGGTVYGSVKAGVWSTDGSKSAETLQEIRQEIKSASGAAFLHHDKPQTQQKALQPSVSWSFSVLESAKTRWNSMVSSVTSALINEQNQWNKLTSMTTGQIKRIREFVESSPKEKPSSKE